MGVRWRPDREAFEIDYADEHGQRRREIIQTTRLKKAQEAHEDAKRLVRRIKAGAATRELPSDPLLEDLVYDHQRWAKQHLSDRGLQSWLESVQPIVGWLRTQHIKRVSQLNPRIITGYQESEREKKNRVSCRTINRRVGALKKMLNQAVQDGVIAQNPIAHVRSLKDDGVRQRRDKTIRRRLSPGEVESLIAAAPKQRKLMWWLVLVAGLRSHELRSLRRTDVDVKKSRILIRGAEAKRRERSQDVWQPIPNDCATALAKHVLSHQQDLVFPSQANTMVQLNNLVNALYRDLKNAGIDNADHSVDVQALRITYISNCADQISNPKVLQQLARHKDVATTLKYYVRAQDSALREVANSFERMAGPR